MERSFFDDFFFPVVYVYPAGQTTRVVQDSLSSILEEALALLRHRDRLEIFYYPVDQNAVPGYSKTISHPMDFSTMATKIRDCVYTSTR